MLLWGVCFGCVLCLKISWGSIFCVFLGSLPAWATPRWVVRVLELACTCLLRTHILDINMFRNKNPRIQLVDQFFLLPLNFRCHVFRFFLLLIAIRQNLYTKNMFTILLLLYYKNVAKILWNYHFQKAMDNLLIFNQWNLFRDKRSHRFF